MTQAVIRHFQAEDLEAVKALYTAYSIFVGVDLTFQNYQAEFDGLPGKYTAAYGGALFVAERVDTSTIDAITGLPQREVIGSIAFRSLNETRCELKRLYVKPDARGLKAGHLLVDTALDEAKRQGYRSIVLDSLDWMSSALAIYERAGFVTIEPYYFNPHQGVVFLEKIIS